LKIAVIDKPAKRLELQPNEDLDRWILDID
jgi:hypothetical protein